MVKRYRWRRSMVDEPISISCSALCREKMAQRSHVPQFGNWESGDNVPYTVFFDKARKGRGGKIANPNDPQESPDMFPDDAPSHSPAPIAKARSEPEESIGQGAVRPAHERRRSRDDGDLRQYANSPARNDNTSRRAPNESGQQRYGGRGAGSGETQRRPARPSAGSEHSVERSPLHPQARISGRGSGVPSPSWDPKNSYESSHGTPNRSRMRPATRGDDAHDNSAAVPKFGGWDENDPSSAEGYTGIFNKVREERHNGAGSRVPGINDPYAKVAKPTATDSTKMGCFSWCRK